MVKQKPKIYIVLGPTASGKTELGVSLAERFSGEIISADSMQIYRDTPIATAVPTMEERRGIEHHLMTFVDCDQPFSVADYVALAKKKIDEVLARGNTPIIVGGTGLYISSLCDNIQFTPQKTDEKLRRQLAERARLEGGEVLLEELRQFDPETASRLHKNDTVRITRAIEIYLTTGKTLTEQNALSKVEPSPYDACFIGLNFRDREVLYDRINRRVSVMVESGLLDEVGAFYEKYRENTKFAAIGVKELIPYIKGECPLSEALDIIRQESRRYAKRQLTWFRRDERINWLYPDAYEDGVEYCRTKVIEDAVEIMEKFGNM